jgi:diacylglycerol kinase family enzyme
MANGGWRHVLRYGTALVLGRLSRLPDVEIITARHLTITGPRALPVQADGDIIAELPVTITVADRTLELVIP